MNKGNLLSSISSYQKAILGLLLVLCFFKFILYPLNQWKKDSVDKIAVMKKVILAKENLVKQSKDIQATQTKASEIFKTASTLFFNKVTDPGDLQLKTQKMLEKIAQKNQVAIKSIQWEPVTGEALIQVPLTLTLAARPYDVLTFMADIELSDKFYTLDQVRIVCRPNVPDVIADLTVSAYGAP